MKIKAVVFDMDGTILDTLKDLTNSVNHALSKMNMPLRTIEEIRNFVGNGVRVLMKRSVAAGTSDSDYEIAFSLFREHYIEHCKDTTKPYDGINELIERLRKKGYLTAVVSNKADFAVQELVDRFYDGLFDAAIGARDGMNNKPAPDMVNLALSEMKISKEEAIYIGDSDVDLETAKNSELPCIGVIWGFRGEQFLKEHGAKYIAKTPGDIEKILEELNK